MNRTPHDTVLPAGTATPVGTGPFPGSARPPGDGPRGEGAPEPGGLLADGVLPAALARARGPEPPAPDTPAGARVTVPPGPGLPVPGARPGRCEPDLDRLLRAAFVASDPAGRFRPAASAGALHPVDVRVRIGPDGPLPAGSYAHHPLRHRLHPLPEPAGAEPDGTPGVLVELGITARRTVSHYGHRAAPLLLLDLGHAAGALYAAAVDLGTEPRCDLSGTRADPPVTIRLGRPDNDRGTRPGVSGTVGGPRPRSAPQPLTGRPDPEILAGLLGVLADAHRIAAADTGEPAPGATDPGEPDPVWWAADEEGLFTVDPGRPGGPLRRRARGDARPWLAARAAGQGWLADAGAILFAVGCPGDADAVRIRRDHLRAGFAAHLASIAAARLGTGCRPIGSWQGADPGAALGRPANRELIVHGLALGTAPPAPASPPGRPPVPTPPAGFP